MDHAKERAAWDHTATLIAMQINSNPFRSGQAVEPKTFHPHYAAEEAAAAAKPLKTDLSILRTLVVDKGPRKKPAPTCP